MRIPVIPTLCLPDFSYFMKISSNRWLFFINTLIERKRIVKSTKHFANLTKFFTHQIFKISHQKGWLHIFSLVKLSIDKNGYFGQGMSGPNSKFEDLFLSSNCQSIQIVLKKRWFDVKCFICLILQGYKNDLTKLFFELTWLLMSRKLRQIDDFSALFELKLVQYRH